jgi:hypothetical protein
VRPQAQNLLAFLQTHSRQKFGHGFGLQRACQAAAGDDAACLLYGHPCAELHGKVRLACSANLQYGPHNWRASQLHFAMQPCTRMPGNSWLACQCQCQGLLAACCCTLPDNGFLCLLLARAACAFDASCPGRSTISCKWSSLQANSKKKLVVSMVAADAGNHTTAFAVRSAAETS